MNHRTYLQSPRVSPSHTVCAGCGQHLELSYLHGVEHWTALAAENEAARMVATKESFIFLSVEQKVFHCDVHVAKIARVAV